MNHYLKPLLLTVCLLLLLWGNGATTRAQQPAFTITRVSVGTGGLQANDEAGLNDIAGNGRYVAFVSRADNLVPGDTNEANDIFVHDRESGETERISVASDGTEGDAFSTAPAISADGRFVAFTSGANNLVPDDTFLGGDIFVRDRVNGLTTLVSVNSDGEQADGNSYGPAISPDGTYIAFVSGADNLDPRTANSFHDQIYLHNRVTGDTRLLSVNSRGEVADDRSGNFLGGGIAVSNGGTYVAFVSTATNLVENDTNGKRDIFLYRRGSSTLQRLSRGRNGAEANGDAWSVRMSDDGQRILFDADADNLVADDTNERTDLFVYDLAAAEMLLVSRARSGGAGEGADGDISGDGRYVAYASNSGQHVTNDCGAGQNCVYRYDILLDETILLSVNAAGDPAGNHAQEARIAGDGRAIAFQSLWDGFVADDTNEHPDLFVYEVGSGAPPVVSAAFLTDVRQAPDGRFVLPWGADDDLPVLIGLDQAHGVTVTVPLRVVAADEAVTEHLITFPPQVTEQQFVVVNPRDAISTTYNLQLLTGEEQSSAAHRHAQHEPQFLTNFFVAFLGSEAIDDGTELCYYAMWCWLTQLAGWHEDDCFLLPFAATLRSAGAPTVSRLETLYATRDTVMKQTPVGRYYIQLYYSHSAEMAELLRRHPTVLWETWDGVTAWLPALTALNSGTGSDVVISEPMITDLETVLALLSTHGSAALQATIATQRAQLDLASYIGLSMDQAWVQVNEQPAAELYLPLVQR